MPAPTHPPVFWRFVLCDLDGKAISMLTYLAQNVEMEFRLNRPASLAFDVPSESPLVAILHTDGEPYLSCGNRVVKAYRKTGSTAVEEPGGWSLKFVGRVWQLQDQGDGDTVRTAVTCFDFLKDLEKRSIRDAAGNYRKQVQFTRIVAGNFHGVPGSQIIKTMIDRSIAFVGSLRLDTGGTWDDTAEQVGLYDQAYILPEAIKLTDTGTVDLHVQYLDSTTGNHMRLGASAREGTDRHTSTIFGYAAPPRTATTYDRTLTMDTFANDIYLLGKSNQGAVSHAQDATSQDKYDVFEEMAVVADVQHQLLLDSLADEQLALRKMPQELVAIVPAPLISEPPWTGWYLGDTVTLNAGAGPVPVTRQGIIGRQRVYGFKVARDAEVGERVTEIIVSSQAEGS